MRMAAAAAALALCGSLAGAAGLAQSTAQRPQATFRTAVDYVEVDVIVTDASGAFAHGLAAGDFELFEDGQPQAIEGFHEVDVPARHALHDRDIVGA